MRAKKVMAELDRLYTRLNSLETVLGEVDMRTRPKPLEPWEKSARDIIAAVEMRHGSGGANHPKVRALYAIRNQARALLEDKS